MCPFKYTYLHNQWFKSLLHRVGTDLKILGVPFEHQTAHWAALSCHLHVLALCFDPNVYSGNEIITISTVQEHLVHRHTVILESWGVVAERLRASDSSSCVWSAECMFESWSRNLCLRSRNLIRTKLLLSRKLRHQVRSYANKYLSNYQLCPLPLRPSDQAKRFGTPFGHEKH